MQPRTLFLVLTIAFGLTVVGSAVAQESSDEEKLEEVGAAASGRQARVSCS